MLVFSSDQISLCIVSDSVFMIVLVLRQDGDATPASFLPSSFLSFYSFYAPPQDYEK